MNNKSKQFHRELYKLLKEYDAKIVTVECDGIQICSRVGNQITHLSKSGIVDQHCIKKYEH